MHSHTVEQFTHTHQFLGEAHERNERKTWAVIALCTCMMIAEIVGGLLFGSVALIADGIHMATHAGALFIAAMAYTLARRYASSDRLAFGAGKFGDLAAFSSAIILGLIALMIGYESVERLLHPVSISFREAIPIACVGLFVNLLSAYLLRDDHQHGRAHGHSHHLDHHHDAHGHADVHTDHNLRAAFVHVLADAAVSVLVILGLTLGLLFGWVGMDPIMGLVATLVILSWSWTLIRSAGAVLIDAVPANSLRREIEARLEQEGDRITDLHIWRVGPGHLATIVSIVSDCPSEPSFYKQRLTGIEGLSHVTVEVARCPGAH